MKKLNVFAVSLNKEKNDYFIEKIGTIFDDSNRTFIKEDSVFKLFDSGNQIEKTPLHLRDSSPDYWGRQVIARLLKTDLNKLSEFDFLLYSNFDRVGNLYFSETEDVDSIIKEIKQEDKDQSLLNFDKMNNIISIEENMLDKSYALNLMSIRHGTSIGGARPKAVIEYNGKRWLAKLASSSDIYPVIKLERFGLEMAKFCGIDTVEAQMLTLPTIDKLGNQKEALLVQRFDRVKYGEVFERKSFMSFLTFLGLSEDEARYASYLDVAKLLSKEDKTELYKRMAFNICIGNTDDHARNFALFWNHLDQSVKLTPVYDVVPFPRAGNEASHSMINGIDENGKESRSNKLANILHSDVLEKFDLSKEEAVHILNHLLKNITRFKKDFDYDFDAKLIEKPILNESIFYGLEEDLLIEFEATMLIEQQKQTEKVIKVNNLKL